MFIVKGFDFETVECENTGQNDSLAVFDVQESKAVATVGLWDYDLCLTFEPPSRLIHLPCGVFVSKFKDGRPVPHSEQDFSESQRWQFRVSEKDDSLGWIAFSETAAEYCVAAMNPATVDHCDWYTERGPQRWVRVEPAGLKAWCSQNAPARDN